MSIEGLSDLIIARTGSKSKKRFVPYEAAYGKAFDDMARRVPSLKRIWRQIGYERSKNLEQTLEIIVNHVRETDE